IGRDRCGCWSDFLLDHPMSNAVSDAPMLPNDDLMRVRSLLFDKTRRLGWRRRHGCSDWWWCRRREWRRHWGVRRTAGEQPQGNGDERYFAHTFLLSCRAVGPEQTPANPAGIAIFLACLSRTSP